MAVAALAVADQKDPSRGQQWVLQLGYFADLQNALDYKDRLVAAGFDAETLTSGEPGNQLYRVICGWADEPEDFDSLRNRLEDEIGDRGYVRKNPYFEQQRQVVTESPEDAFDYAHRRTMLAQAGNIQPAGGEGVGSVGNRAYDSNMFRTPQDEIESIPGATLMA